MDKLLLALVAFFIITSSFAQSIDDYKDCVKNIAALKEIKLTADIFTPLSKLEVGQTYFIPKGSITLSKVEADDPAKTYVNWIPQKKGASKSQQEQLNTSGPFLFENDGDKFLVAEGGVIYKFTKEFNNRKEQLFLVGDEVNLDGFFYHEIGEYWGYTAGIKGIGALEIWEYIENNSVKYLGYKHNNYIFDAGGRRILWNKSAALKYGGVFQTPEQKNAIADLKSFNHKFAEVFGAESILLLDGKAKYATGYTDLLKGSKGTFTIGKFKEVVYFQGLKDKNQDIPAGYYLSFENDLVTTWKKMYFSLADFDRIYAANPSCYLEPRKTTGTECLYTKKEKNGFDGSVTITTTTQPIGVVEFPYFDYTYSLSRFGDNYYMVVFPSWDKGCSSYDSYISFKFADGSILQSKHLTDIDCSAKAAISILINKELLAKLQTSELHMIRVVQTKGSVDLTLLSTNAIGNQLSKCMKVE